MHKTDEMPVNQIRRARRSESAEISTLIASSFALFERHASATVFELYVENSCDLAARWDEAEVMVIESAGRIAGTVTYYADAGREGLGWPQGWAGFRTLAVHPSLQRHGFGRQLAEWCVQTARREGASTIGIHTASFMRVACGLYERMGFQRCSRYDLLASSVFDFDPVLGDVSVIACSLQLARSRPDLILPTYPAALFMS